MNRMTMPNLTLHLRRNTNAHLEEAEILSMTFSGSPISVWKVLGCQLGHQLSAETFFQLLILPGLPKPKLVKNPKGLLESVRNNFKGTSELRKNKTVTFHSTGCLIGIHIMAYYNPYITE